MRDWSYLSYWLAVAGIPSEITEDIMVGNSELSPWSPPHGAEVLHVTITKESAANLVQLLSERFASVVEEER